MTRFLFVFVATLLTVANSKTLPTFPQPCHKSDPDISSCYLNVFNKLKPFVATGFPEFNIPSLDPLEENVVSVSQVVNALFAVDAIAKNSKIVGLSQFHIDNLKAEVDKHLIEMDVTFPHLKASTDFKLILKLANSTINLQGSLTTGDFFDTKLSLAIRVKEIKKGGVGYFAVDTFNPNIKVGHGHIQVTSKKPQDQSIADFITRIYNEDDGSFLELLNPVITNILGGIFRTRLEEGFARVPVEKFLID